MSKGLHWFLSCVGLALLAFGLAMAAPVPSMAADEAEEAFSPSDLIRLINAYRAENGLYALGTDSKLARAAQQQAEYQSSLGHWTHTGPDGSTPMDRAYAMGYGDGKKIFATEITYCGGNGTPENAVAWWKQSSVHNYYMLTDQYVEMGAGEAVGNANCYTVVMGWITGVPAPSVDETGGDESGGEYVGNDGETIQQQLIIPVSKAEPREDGSVWHTVMPGQAMWNIWALYSEDYPDLTIDELYEKNDLSVWDYLVEGTELLIDDGTGATTASGTAADATVDATGDGGAETVSEPVEDAPVGPAAMPVSATPRPTITLMAMAAEETVTVTPTANALDGPEEAASGMFANFSVLHWALVGVFCLMVILIVIAFLTGSEEAKA